MWAALIVAFIAGYAIVSFLARKIKSARDNYPGNERKDDDSKPF